VLLTDGKINRALEKIVAGIFVARANAAGGSRRSEFGLPPWPGKLRVWALTTAQPGSAEASAFGQDRPTQAKTWVGAFRSVPDCQATRLSQSPVVFVSGSLVSAVTRPQPRRSYQPKPQESGDALWAPHARSVLWSRTRTKRSARPPAGIPRCDGGSSRVTR